MQAIDQGFLDFCLNIRTEWFSFLMLVITYSGSYMLVGSLTALSAASFYIHRHYMRMLQILVAVGGSGVTVFLIKNIFYRARPFAEAIYLESSSSFPSGHAAMAMALYGFIFYAIWKHEKHHLKNPFIFFLGILIVLVGFSRLYLGVHYLSDVLAGYVIGLVWILISLSVSKLSFLRLPDDGRL